MLTVIAKDTSAAMDEVVSKLGTDAMIVSTRKVSEGVEVTATGESTLEFQSNRKKPYKKLAEEYLAKPHAITNPANDASQQSQPEAVTELARQTQLIKSQIYATIDTQLDQLVEDLKKDVSVTTPWGLMQNALANDINFEDNFTSEVIDKDAVIDKFALLLSKVDTDALYEADEIFLVGGSGAGKSTLAAKLALLLEQNCSEITLIETNKNTDCSILQTFAEKTGKKYDHDDVECGQHEKHIKEINITDFFEKANNNEAGLKQVVFLVLPAGLSTKSYKSVLTKFEAYDVQIALTKIDEFDIELADMIELYNVGKKVALFSASPDISSEVYLATEKVMNSYIKENMSG